MAGLRVFTGNRLEILADKLGALLSAPLSSPLAPEVIIVQSPGMERWLSMEIAHRHGICANVRFPFPKAFIQEAFAALLGSAPDAEAFSPDVMTWKIMKLLPDLCKRPGFEQIKGYLVNSGTSGNPSPENTLHPPPHPLPSMEGDADGEFSASFGTGTVMGVSSGEEDAPPEAGGENETHEAGTGLKLLQLAERIAYLFDQYLIFRPDMVAAWEKGGPVREEERWQCDLWRALMAGAEESHPAALKEEFLHRSHEIPPSSPLCKGGIGGNTGFPRIESGAGYVKPGGDLTKKVCSGLPERIFVFGISSLPPFHLEIFHSLAALMEVNLFVMNPSREFWGHIRSGREREREVARVREKTGDYLLSPEALYLEGGNRLLASMGALGREFFSLVGEFSGEEGDFFADPGEDSLLAAVQSDILNLRNRGAGEKKLIDLNDRSIQFHSCHSPIREIEALYDNLLCLFEENETLLPKDICVMAPDIEVYAPLIKAVFDRPKGARPDATPSIPFTIADRGSLAESSVLEAFVKLLDMTGGRFGAGEVLAPLETPAIAAKFGITQAELDIIRNWVAETGIRWGMDGENRRKLGLPARHENTWHEGLERLLMGYAMPGREGRLVDGILPYDVEGSETVVLGKLLAYTEALFSHISALAGKRTLTEWSRTLTGLLDSLFLPGEDREEETLRHALARLRRLQELSGFPATVGLEVIKACLGKIFTEKGFGYGFLTGGVTFCSLLPMRSIPFKVICLLGMNGADYPRKSWAQAFDLMARHPRPCDRSRRKDDRYLFLEALLSARERLIVSYVGQSSEDNSSLPPSVLVTELLDYLEEGFSLSGGGNLREAMVTNHRLQAVSPAYFQGSGKLASYSEENWRAAACLIQKKEGPAAPRPLIPAPDDSWRNVGIVDLVSFFADPVRFLLQRRLQVSLGGVQGLLEEREPFFLKDLDRYALEQRLVQRGITDLDLKDYLEVARASGRLPHGAMGTFSYRSLLEAATEFAGKARTFVSGKDMARRDLDLSIAGFRLSGRMPLYGGGLVHFRYATLKARDCLSLWIHHLALNIQEEGKAPPSILLSKDGAWRFSGLPKAEETMAALLDKYWRGLQQPLKFFPLSSWEYGKRVFGDGKTREAGRQAAIKVWRGNDFQTGESENPYYRTCFGDGEPLDEEFEETGETILKDIFQLREEITDL